MKKLFMLFSIAGALSFAACGGAENQEEPAAEPETTEEPAAPVEEVTPAVEDTAATPAEGHEDHSH